MIFTTFSELPRYKGLTPALDTAIDYLQKADLSALTPGRNEVDGDSVYINRFDYDTIPEEEGSWEGHILFGDIHIDLAGHEEIGVTNAADLTETVRKPEEDFVGYTGKVDCRVHMVPGKILIVFPGDAHLVKATDGTPARVAKAVVKFRA